MERCAANGHTGAVERGLQYLMLMQRGQLGLEACLAHLQPAGTAT